MQIIKEESLYRQNLMNTYKLGIDIGSTTVKIALIDNDGKVAFSDYERHFANIQDHFACAPISPPQTL